MSFRNSHLWPTRHTSKLLNVVHFSADDKRIELEDILRGPAFENLVKKYIPVTIAEQQAEVEPEIELPVMVHIPKQKKRKHLPTTDEVFMLRKNILEILYF